MYTGRMLPRQGGWAKIQSGHLLRSPIFSLEVDRCGSEKMWMWTGVDDLCFLLHFRFDHIFGLYVTLEGRVRRLDLILVPRR